MKNLLSILVVLALATTLAFSVPNVNDNLTTGKTGTGTFTCSVLKALTVTTTAPTGSMGEFVVSSTDYVPAAQNVITFAIDGDLTHSGFYYKLCSDTEDAIADITIDWGLATAQLHPESAAAWTPGTLVSGAYVITGTVTAIEAKLPGTATFLQTLVVSYNNL